MVHTYVVPTSEGLLEREILTRANLHPSHQGAVASALDAVHSAIENRDHTLILNDTSLSAPQRWRLTQTLSQVIPGYYPDVQYMDYAHSSTLYFFYHR